MQACRICLVMNMKMYDIKHYNLYIYYEQITGLNTNEEKLPQMLCWECAHRLVKGVIFKNKALRSHKLMMDILQKKHFLTQKSLKTLNRQNLKSTLTCKTYDVNHNDLHLHDNTPLIPDFKDEKSEEDTFQFEMKNEETAPEIDVQNEIDNHVYDIDFAADEAEDSISSSDMVLSNHKEKNKRHKKSVTKLKAKKIVKRDRRRKPATEVLTKDMFTITDLSVDEQILEIQKRKDTENFKRCGFQCTVCYKGFLDEEAYNGHMIRHTDQSGLHACVICKVHFKSAHGLRNHMTAHMQKFSCNQCPYVTTRRHAAKLHEDYHKGTKYECPHCQADFGKFTTYLSHLRIKHPSDFVCALCGHSFVSAKGISQHQKLKHRFDMESVPSDGPYCEVCEVRFASREALEKHLKLSARHNDTDTKGDRRKRPRQENDRGENRGRKQLKRSKPEHRPIPCEQCDMQLPDALSYYRHFRRAHPDKNRTTFPSDKVRCMCEHCGKMFQSLALLQDHSSIHWGGAQFQCPQCGKRFQRHYRLLAHRRLHARPAAQRDQHRCAHCSKGFSSKSNLRRHMVSHTGLKLFTCEMCGKAFKHASEKRVHITYVHLKKPWPKRSRGKRRTERQPQVQAEQDNIQPLWPACDPKGADIALHEKPVYLQP